MLRYALIPKPHGVNLQKVKLGYVMDLINPQFHFELIHTSR